MTSRSRLYFKFKNAYRLLSTDSGRQWLADLGLYQFREQTTGAGIYFIDKKGNIIGTTVHKVSPEFRRDLYYPKPDPMPTTTTVRISWAFDAERESLSLKSAE